jgi:hypothetical protein
MSTARRAAATDAAAAARSAARRRETAFAGVATAATPRAPISVAVAGRIDVNVLGCGPRR